MAVEEAVSPNASLQNLSLGRKISFYHHFSEQCAGPCNTVSCRGAGETPKRGPKKYLIGSNWLTSSDGWGVFVLLKDPVHGDYFS